MRKEWSEREEEYLLKMYWRVSSAKIAKKYNRTVHSVRRKAQSLGLNSYVGDMLHVKTLSKCFNCDSSVINRWINVYDLSCVVIERGQMTFKLIQQEDFWKWAEQHKNLIPWHKYQLQSVLPEPTWLEETLRNYQYKNNRMPITPHVKNQVLTLKKKGLSIREISLATERTTNSIRHILRDYNKHIVGDMSVLK